MNNAAARNETLIRVGLDLGALVTVGPLAHVSGCRRSREDGQRGKFGQYARATRNHGTKLSRATVVMEAGMHSPWVSRFLQELGLRVIVVA